MNGFLCVFLGVLWLFCFQVTTMDQLMAGGVASVAAPAVGGRAVGRLTPAAAPASEPLPANPAVCIMNPH